MEVPTIEGLLGDKLTAFAPNTVGVPCKDGREMQVIKQLFDVGALFDAAKDFPAVAQAYEAVFRLENRYREGLFKPGEALGDTLETARRLCHDGLKGAVPHAHQPLLEKGRRLVVSHLIGGAFTKDDAKVAAAKAAFLAAALRDGPPQRLMSVFPYDSRQAAHLGSVELSDGVLQRLRGSNPEAFYYWALAEGKDIPRPLQERLSELRRHCDGLKANQRWWNWLENNKYLYFLHNVEDRLMFLLDEFGAPQLKQRVGSGSVDQAVEQVDRLLDKIEREMPLLSPEKTMTIEKAISTCHHFSAEKMRCCDEVLAEKLTLPQGVLREEVERMYEEQACISPAPAPPTPAAHAQDSTNDEENTKEKHCFYRDQHNVWHIGFPGGDDFTLQDLLGLQFIHHLLSKPGVDVSADDLYAASTNAGSRKPVAAGEALDAGLSRSGAVAEPIMDKPEEEALKKDIKDLHTEIEETEGLGPSETLLEKRQKLQGLLEALRKSRGIHGKARRLSSGKKRTVVQKAIQRALGKIKDRHKPLWEHLDACIQTGNECSYKPKPVPSWEL
ncbi:MAG: hypothetical protein ABSE73_01480 [Planctomycetota bacterium]